MHGDLSARNLLVDENQTLKISDFGMSWYLFEYTAFRKDEQQQPIPWRWMAPEFLEEMRLSDKTDVWAFGVTLWEMYSLGSLPFAGYNLTADFLPMLKNGLRMEKPKFCENDLHSIMLACWELIPENRPSFANLKQWLTQINLSKHLTEYSYTEVLT